MGSLHDGDVVHLPVIDISEPTGEVAKQMLDAAIKYGFLYINPKGTGFKEEDIARLFELSKQFFALTSEEKAECTIDKSNRGWTGMYNEILDPQHQRKGDFKEAMNIGQFRDGKPQQKMPRLLAEHVNQLTDFETRCQQVCNILFDLLAVGLEIPDTKFFSSRHGQPSGCTVRMLKYPALASDVDYQPEVDIRAGAHSDYGSITLLFQRPSQPGLEIRTPDNTWAPVPVFPKGYTASTTFPPILVNIGDLLSYWTNGLLKSTIHRVIFPKEARRGGEDRYSIVYFCHPKDDTELIPVPSQMVADLKPLEAHEVGYGGGLTDTKALTAKEHLEQRLAATYGFRAEKSA